MDIIEEIKIKEHMSDEEAEDIIKEYTNGYMFDGFEEWEARSMAVADFIYEYGD